MDELLNNEYRVGRLIGSGAESDVFEAVSATLNSRVALKVFRSGPHNPELLDRLRKVKGNFVGPCPAILDYFEHRGQVVAVMEFVEGVPLTAFLVSNDWSVKKREHLAEALIGAVGELHAEGLLHGDLSPGNVLVCADGRIKLIDPRLSSGRVAGSIFGTANHVAPELLIFNNSATSSADIFSLATILFEIFEGVNPFGCKSQEEYVLKAGTKNLVPGAFIRTPHQFKRMIAAGLDLDSRSRPGTIRNLLRLKSKRVNSAVIALGGLLLLSGMIAFLFARNRQILFDDVLGANVLELKTSDLFILDNVGKSPFYLRQFPGADRLVVCNAHSPYLSTINMSPKPSLAAQVSLRGNHSHDFVPFESGRRALVSSSVTDAVVVLDLKTLRPVKVLGNESGTQWFLHPDAVAVSEANSHAYVTSWRGGFVTVIDLRTLRPIMKIDVSPGPSGAVISRDGQALYISHTVVRFNPETRVSEGVVTVINTKTNRVIRKIPNVGKESSDVKLLPDSDVAVTANFRGQSLSMINTSGQERLSDIALHHGSPIDQAVSTRGPYIFVANFNHPYVHIVNYKTGAILLVLKSKYFGRETNGIVLSQDERYVCLTNTETDQVVCFKNGISDWERLVQ